MSDQQDNARGPLFGVDLGRSSTPAEAFPQFELRTHENPATGQVQYQLHRAGSSDPPVAELNVSHRDTVQIHNTTNSSPIQDAYRQQIMQMLTQTRSVANAISSTTASVNSSWYDFDITPGSDSPEQKKETMLAQILRLYTAAMAGDIRSPLVHLVGPPGCGKSTSVEKAAEMLGVNMHVINVSRISPLEIEGLQMPVDSNTRIEMLLAAYWNQLQDGDIVLLDEFLRGFPEVYNGLLDILTSRRVGKHELPKVFFIAASNSTVKYDKALEDRLLDLPVVDARNHKSERTHIAKTIVEATGMMPSMVTHFAMEDLIKQEILPMYAMLDQFNGKANVGANSIKGSSPRKLIGQVGLRQIESTWLRELLKVNNREAMSKQQFQFVILPDGKSADPGYVARAEKLRGNPRLTEIQARNLDLNLQLVEMEAVLAEASEVEEEDDDDPQPF